MLDREAAKRDPAEFLRACKIADKDTGTLIDFNLWPAQESFVTLMEENDRVFGLKARQLGFTWVVLGHMLRQGLFWGGRDFLIVRQSGEDGADSIKRLKIMHDSLPASWQQSVASDNVMTLKLGNKSTFHALTATRHVGRGYAAYAGFADEFAFWGWPDEQLAALDAACARLYAVTTGNGPGDHAHAIWEGAEAGRGRWVTAFYPWHSRPDRLDDPDWYRLNVEEAPEPRLARREYAATAEEAFAAPEGIYFERFSRDRNVKAVSIEPSWPTWRAIDFGFRHPACLWAQRSPAGQLFIVSELLPENLPTREFRDAIVAQEAEWGLAALPQASYCDPAGKAANVQTAESEFEVLRHARLYPKGKPSSVRDGCMRIMDALADPDLPLVISEDCPGLIAALSQSKPHKSHPEFYDTDHEVFSHPLDALRYLLVNLKAAASAGPSRAARPAPVGGGWRSTVF